MPTRGALAVKRSLAAALFALACSSDLARAQLAPIGPFVGTDSEPFETQSAVAQPCVSGRVFNNQGDLCTPGASGAYISSGWGFICSIAPHGGVKFAGNINAPEYTFDTPVSRFGGYFGTNCGSPDATLTFYDGAGNVLGVETASFAADCAWHWNGWSAPSPAIRRVAIQGLNPFGGGFVMMDDMQADFGPALVVPYCAGDGSAGACPCGNAGGAGEGCAHSMGAVGALLTAAGSTSFSADDLVLTAAQLPSQQFGIVFVGDTQVAGGLGAPVLDGLVCASGNVMRYPAQLSSGTGPADGVIAQSSPVAGSNGLISGAGQTWNFQCWYRNVPAGISSCGTGANFSNALAVTYTP
jgi:hypothetical protein